MKHHSDTLRAAAPDMARRPGGYPVRAAVFALFVAALLALPLLPVPEFWITQLNYIGLYAIVVVGVVLLTGMAGLTSFGQAAFVGLGAYATGVLSVTYGVSPWLGLLAGLAVTACAALLIGPLTLRMSGHYLPVATIAWGLAVFYLLSSIDWLGKYDGLMGIAPVSIGSLVFDTGRSQFYLIWAFALAAMLVAGWLLDSRSGRAIRALRDGTVLAEAMGVNTLRYKIGVFVLAALFASVSGWLFAHFQRSVNPSPFGLHMGIQYLFMAVLGGLGSVWGALTGAAAVKLIEDQLQVLIPALLGRTGSFEVIAFGIILVLVLKYARQGIWSFLDGLAPRARRRRDWAEAAALPVRPKPERGAVVLEGKGLRRQFGGLVAVNDVDLAVRAGDIVGLIGPNGAGKSTTFHLLSGVLALSAGEILLHGRRVDGLPSRVIASRGLARTFQHVKMIPDMSVLENVALGAHLRGGTGPLRSMLRLDRPQERSLLREAEAQLARVGLGEHLHEPAGNLAMGLQRLMEIARALCSDPAVLLLDEPAAGLRHFEKQALAKVLRQLREEGMGILLVEHDMDLMMNVADRIVVMEFGTRLMEGTPAEVRASPAVRAAYLGTEH